MSIQLPRRTPRMPIRLLVGLAWLTQLALATPVHANRFGPPWQSRVVVDQTTLFSQPDRTSAAVGPLIRGQLVVVVNEKDADDGTAWTQVPDGWLVSRDVAEETAPWIAEVSL